MSEKAQLEGFDYHEIGLGSSRFVVKTPAKDTGKMFKSWDLLWKIFPGYGWEESVRKDGSVGWVSIDRVLKYHPKEIVFAIELTDGDIEELGK